MPNYYNPANFYPATYLNQLQPISYSGTMQPAQSFSPQGPKCAMMWISDEMEARGQQIPQGYTQLAMWDTNNPVIYLKSLNQMGMPNPMQVIHYTFDQLQAQGTLPAGQSGDAGNGQVRQDMSQYVTKQDLEQIRQDLMKAIAGRNDGNSGNNQNGNNNGQNGNRGGNRNG